MRGRDGGYALVWGLALSTALIIVGGAGLSLVGLAMAHLRAGNAAYLAAIAAVSASLDPCSAAERVANANSAELLECDAVGSDVIVRVRVQAPAIAQWLGSDRLEVMSRAGTL